MDILSIPMGLFLHFPLSLGEKLSLVEVEVVNAPIDYNFLLRWNWFYEMKVVAYSIFHVKHFPHQGNIVTIDQLDYCTPDLRTSANTNVPFVGDYLGGYASVSMGIFKDSSLLETFTLPSPHTTHLAPIIIISSIDCSFGSYDPWIILDPLEVECFRASMLLSSTLSDDAI
jgi:hypothetical protein